MKKFRFLSYICLIVSLYFFVCHIYAWNNYESDFHDLPHGKMATIKSKGDFVYLRPFGFGVIEDRPTTETEVFEIAFNDYHKEVKRVLYLSGTLSVFFLLTSLNLNKRKNIKS